MSFWTGTQWTDDEAGGIKPPRPTRRRHILGALAEGALLSMLVVALMSGTVLAGKGNGRGNQVAASPGSCVVEGTLATAAGLPTDEVINFMLTDAAGTRGWVLGFTDEGTWSEPVPARNGSTTYEFVSRTWGPNGTHYTVFASCSAA